MKTRDLAKIGHSGRPLRRRGEADSAGRACGETQHGRPFGTSWAGSPRPPPRFSTDPGYAGLAQLLLDHAAAEDRFVPRAVDAPYRIWGDNLEATAVQQLKNACKLPVAVSGALMPDAHVGYGLPIGGVLATSDAVIPYAVGVDIACRMKMTVLDLPVSALADDQARLTRALERETRFGIGASFQTRRQHEVHGRRLAGDDA